MTCPFCDPSKIAGPVEKFRVRSVDEGESLSYVYVLVFEPLGPVVPGHLLVVPERHHADATASPRVSGACMTVAAEVAARYQSANIITSIGSPATQTVRHVHLHVVPRADGDGLRLPWSLP